MAKFIILVGSIKTTTTVQRNGKDVHIGKLHSAGDEIELDTAEAEQINKKGPILEPIGVRDARVKAEKDSKAAIEKAAADAKAKGGGK